MSTIWQSDPEFTDLDELIGYGVEALDGDIGTVDDASWDTDTDHLVVDTGAWIFGKKVLIPAGMITSVDHGNELVHLGLTREQVENGPEYDETRHLAADPGVWAPYDDYYRSSGGPRPLT